MTVTPAPTRYFTALGLNGRREAPLTIESRIPDSAKTSGPFEITLRACAPLIAA
jgi:hypothetical protein